MSGQVLQYDFYHRKPEIVARELLGKTLISTIGKKRCAGKIVETEAYLADGDKACHGFRGKTPKNHSMFGPAGFAYVYPIHAQFCFNTVTQSEGQASAVLIRSIEPILGMKTMRSRRGTASALALCSGPGKLCRALGIDKSSDGANLTSKRKIWIEMGPSPVDQTIRQTTRIGVTSATDLELRFVVKGNPFTSGPRYLSD